MLLDPTGLAMQVYKGRTVYSEEGDHYRVREDRYLRGDRGGIALAGQAAQGIWREGEDVLPFLCLDFTSSSWRWLPLISSACSTLLNRLALWLT